MWYRYREGLSDIRAMSMPRQQRRSKLNSHCQDSRPTAIVRRKPTSASLFSRISRKRASDNRSHWLRNTADSRKHRLVPSQPARTVACNVSSVRPDKRAHIHTQNIKPPRRGRVGEGCTRESSYLTFSGNLDRDLARPQPSRDHLSGGNSRLIPKCAFSPSRIARRISV